MSDPINSISAKDCSANNQQDIAERFRSLHSAAGDFEAVFVQQMLQDMQKTLKDGGLIGSGTSGSIYSGMFTEAVAKSMVQTQGLGLAPKLYEQVINRDPELKTYAQTHGIDWEHPNGQKINQPVLSPSPSNSPQQTHPTDSTQKISDPTSFIRSFPLQNSLSLPIDKLWEIQQKTPDL